MVSSVIGVNLNDSFCREIPDGKVEFRFSIDTLVFVCHYYDSWDGSSDNINC